MSSSSHASSIRAQQRWLTVEVSLVAAVVAAVALSFAAVLSFLKMSQMMVDLTAARLAMTAESVQEQVQTGLDLGLELTELLDVADVLRRAVNAPGILAVDLTIEIRDPSGLVVFATDESRLGAVSRLPAMKSRGRYRQLTESGNQLLLAFQLRDALGRHAGDVVLQADLQITRLVLEGFRSELGQWAWPLVGLAFLASLTAAGWVTRQALRHRPELAGRSDG